NTKAMSFLLAEIHHFRAAVVNIATQGDSGSRTVPADAAYEPAQMARDLLTGRRRAWTQQQRQRPARRDVVDVDGEHGALAVRGIERRQGLMAVHHVERVIDIERHCDRRRCVARAIKSIITPMRRMTSRRFGAFSQRDMVGCEHRSSPLSGNRPQASLKAGSKRSRSRSLASS